MNLSRRSLLLSLVLHSFLVLSGYFWLSQREEASGPPAESSLPTELVTRPVKLKEKPPKVKQISPKLPSSTKRLPGNRNPQAPSAPEPEASGEETTAKAKDKPKSKPLSSGPAYPQAKPSIPRKKPSKPASPKSTRKPKQTAKQINWSTAPVKTPAATGEGGKASTATRRARPSSQPEFNLTERFPQLASVSVKAEFKIAADGSFESTLLTSSGNPTADVVIMGKLLEYTWLPALEKGVPKEDTRVLDIGLDD